MIRVLVVEDQALITRRIKQKLEKALSERCSFAYAASYEDGKKLLQEIQPQLVLLDVIMPIGPGNSMMDEQAGFKLIEERDDVSPRSRVIVFSEQDRERAVELLLAHKVIDYLFKDTPWPEIIEKFSQHVKTIELELRKEAQQVKSIPLLVGESASMATLREKISLVAKTDSTVLLLGETGTGKELAADSLHSNSGRRSGPMVKVNCAALSEELLASELFGHVKGAFTGATAYKAGKFEVADTGTLFLDEVGEIPMSIQAKLLRVLQERSFEPVGSNRTIRVDVRLIAATNRDLREEVAEGRFREDLFFRLNVFPIELPPLRQRTGDIPQLLSYFQKILNSQLARQVEGISPEAVEYLASHNWPGNVRELRNSLEAAFIYCTGNTLEVRHLETALAGRMNMKRAASSLSNDFRSIVIDELTTEPFNLLERVSEIEVIYLEQALEKAGGNGALAARMLGLKEHTFRKKARKAGIWPLRGKSS